MSRYIVHREDVQSESYEEGGIRTTKSFLGDAAGCKGIALNHIEVPPSARSTPLHAESPEEEIFFVLAGAGLSWQHDGEREHTYEIRAGDCLVHRAGEEAHSLVAGPNGLETLIFGVQAPPNLVWFPRIGAIRVGPALLDVDGRHQWEVEAALGEPELPDPEPRPDTIVNVDEVEPEVEDRGRFGYAWRRLSPRSEQSGLNLDDMPPGKMNCPLHCHSAEEEVFYVLEGDGVCVLAEEEHSVRAGHVVARPPGTRVAHGFRGGPDGMKVLCYGTRDPNDIAYYPTSGKVSFRGVGLTTRVESLDYWDGE